MAPYYVEHKGQKIPVYTRDEWEAKFGTTIKNKNKEVAALQEETALLPVHTSDDADVKPRPAENNKEDKEVTALQEETAVLPAHTSDDADVKPRTAENNKKDKEVTALQEETALLPVHTSDDADVQLRTTEENNKKDRKIYQLQLAIDLHQQGCCNADDKVHQDEIVSLEAMLATAHAKGTTPEQDSIVTLQATIAKLEEEKLENRVLLTHLNMNLYEVAKLEDENKLLCKNLEASQEAVTKLEDENKLLRNNFKAHQEAVIESLNEQAEVVKLEDENKILLTNLEASQEAVTKLEDENKILLINLKAHQEAAIESLNKESRKLAVAKDNMDKMNNMKHKGEGGVLGRVILLIAGFIIAIIAMEVGLILGGRGHRAAMEEWVSELSQTVERMVETAIDHYHFTAGRQAVNGHEL